MKVKIYNNMNHDETWNVISITNSYQVPENTNDSLYNFWLNFETPEIAQEVFNHIAQEDPIWGNKPRGMYVTDNNGYESDNIIASTNNSTFRCCIDDDNKSSVYMEFRNNFEGMNVMSVEPYEVSLI